jgi:flagellar biosynthesis/type III secretory pathway M-ring protein FliF/YscJ
MNALGPGADGAEIPFSPSVIDMAGIEGSLKKSLLAKVCKLVDDFPDRALEVIRGWMAEGR